MESGLECEGDVEETMGVMALREERDGRCNWSALVNGSPRNFSPPRPVSLAQWPAQQ
jgi:hypothetical protein